MAMCLLYVSSSHFVNPIDSINVVKKLARSWRRYSNGKYNATYSQISMNLRRSYYQILPSTIRQSTLPMLNAYSCWRLIRNGPFSLHQSQNLLISSSQSNAPGHTTLRHHVCSTYFMRSTPAYPENSYMSKPDQLYQLLRKPPPSTYRKVLALPSKY
jgi:hypothetical protein